MKLNWKKAAAFMLCATMTLSLAACGNKDAAATDKEVTTNTETTENTESTEKTESTDTAKEDQKITIWAWDDNFNIKAANEAKELYLKENPDVQVEVVSMAQDDIVQKLHASLSSTTYDGLPNIVLIEDYKIQNFLTAYPGEIKELTGKVEADKFMDYKLGVMTEGDKIYGVPFDSGVAALFYRADYLEQAGYTKEDMNNLTWEKYIEIGKAVKEKTGKDMLTLDPSDLGQIRMMMQSAGDWYVKEDGVTVNIAENQALKDSITVYKSMVDSGIAKQIADWDAFLGAFQNGDVASVPSGCWIASSITAAADQSGKWAVAPFPKLGANADSINATNIGGASWYVLDKVGDSELAADFLAKTFASSDELMNSLVKSINLVSTLKSASSSENYSQPSEFFSGQEIFKEFSDWTVKIPTVNYGLHTYAIEDIMTEAVQSIVAGGDMTEILNAAQTQAEAATAQ